MSKIPRVKFKDDSLKTIFEGVALEQVKKVCFDKFIPNIELAIEKNKNDCVFCSSDDFNIVIPKSSYKDVLKTLESYYIGNEDFETCAKIVKMNLKIDSNG